MSDLEQSGIYVLTNTVTGEQYVGQTRNLTARKRAHLWGLATEHPNPSLREAAEKYGTAAFTFEVLERDVPYHQLLEREGYYVNQLAPAYNRNVSMAWPRRQHVPLIQDHWKERWEAELLEGMVLISWIQVARGWESEQDWNRWGLILGLQRLFRSNLGIRLSIFPRAASQWCLWTPEADPTSEVDRLKHKFAEKGSGNG